MNSAEITVEPMMGKKLDGSMGKSRVLIYSVCNLKMINIVSKMHRKKRIKCSENMINGCL
jgi:hypothetical protein